MKAIKELEYATTREQFITSFEKLYGLCLENGPEAPGLAGRYGGVEATITSVASLSKDNHGVAEGLKTLNILLKGQRTVLYSHSIIMCRRNFRTHMK